MQRGKRGLSTVIVTLILILVSLVAVGIVWLVVRNIIQTGTEGIGLSQFSLSAKILDVSIDNSSNNVSLTLKRNAGKGELEGISFVFSNSNADTEVITRNVSMKELEQMTFKFHLSMNVSDLKSVSIIPLIKQDGKEIPGIALDKYNLGGNKVNLPGGQACTPTNCSILGYACGTWNNGTCAGSLNCGTCSGGQTCNASGRCVLQTGYTCGNNLIEPGEACDGTNMSGYTCTSIAAGFASGTLSCSSDCKRYITTSCVAGNTITALNCSQTAVQNAINSASDGDTVIVPACSANWSTPVTCNKGLNIRGAGIGNTIIYDNTTGAWLQEPLVCTTKSGYITSVSGFTFDGNDSAVSSAGMVLMMASTYDAGTFRVHHNEFRNIKIRGCGVYRVYGVIDNNRFITPYDLTAQAVAFLGGGNGNGTIEWTRGLTLGTANAVYIESNVFTYAQDNDGAVDGYNGARIVFRYNNVTNTRIGFHGCDSGGYRGTHSFEIYENDFTTSVDVGSLGFRTRSGTGVVYNNTFTGALYGGIFLTNYRSCASYSPWGMCNGTNPFDGNDDASGYHCQDQAGWTSTGTDNGLGPNQILSPVYAWGNTKDGAQINIRTWGLCAAESLHIVENRDFYNGIAKPGYVPYPYPHPLTLIS